MRALTSRLGALAFNVLSAIALLSAAASARGAVVNWAPAMNISGDADVNTAGTLVGALNLGGAGVPSTTVNGVPFAGTAVGGATVTSGNFTLTAGTLLPSGGASALPPFTTLSAPYRALLSDGVYTPSGLITLTMGGLVAGRTYLFECWSNDSSENFSNPIMVVSAGNSVTLLANTGGKGTLGQYALGTFVADATGVQTVTFDGSPTSAQRLNGFQLRAVPDGTAVPLPRSAAAGLFGLAAAAVFAKRLGREKPVNL